jgi:hypothetical protein
MHRGRLFRFNLETAFPQGLFGVSSLLSFGYEFIHRNVTFPSHSSVTITDGQQVQGTT